MRRCSVPQPCSHGKTRLAGRPGRQTAPSTRCRCSLISPNTRLPTSSAVVTDPSDHGLSVGLQGQRTTQQQPLFHHAPDQQQQQHHHQQQEWQQQHQQLHHAVFQQVQQPSFSQAGDAPYSGATEPPPAAAAAAAAAAPEQRRRHDPFSACRSVEQLSQAVQAYSNRSGAFSSWHVVPALQALQATAPVHAAWPMQQQQQQQPDMSQQQQQQLQAYCEWCTSAQQVLRLVAPHWHQLHGAWLAAAAHHLASVAQLLEATPAVLEPAACDTAGVGTTVAGPAAAAVVVDASVNGGPTHANSSSSWHMGNQHQQLQDAADAAAAGARAALQQLLQQQLAPPAITSALTRAATPAQLLALVQLLGPQLNGLHVTAAIVVAVRLQQQQQPSNHQQGGRGYPEQQQQEEVVQQQQEQQQQEEGLQGAFPQQARLGNGSQRPPAQAAAAAAGGAPVTRVTPAHQSVDTGAGARVVQLAGQLLLEGGLVEQVTAAQAAQLLWAAGRLQEAGVMTLPPPPPAPAALGVQQQQQGLDQQRLQQDDGTCWIVLQQQLLGTCLASLDQLQPKEVVMALHGLTLLRAPLTLSQQQEVVARLQQQLPACSGKELGVVAWCAGQQQFRDPGSAWWASFWQAVQLHLVTPTAAAAVPAAEGGSSVEAKCTSASSHDAPSVVWQGGSSDNSSSSSSRSTGGGDSWEATTSSSNSSVLQPVEVCHVLRAAARLQQAPPADTWQRLQHHVLQHLTMFDQQELAVLLWSWAKLGLPCSTVVVQQLAAAADQQQARLSAQSRALVLLAASRLQQQQQQQQQDDENGLAATLAAAAADDRAGDSSSSSSSSSRWQRLLPTPQQLQQCSVRDVVMVVHAAAQLELELPQGWLEAALRRVCHQPDQVTPQGLLALVTAVQALQQQQQPWEQAGIAACLERLSDGCRRVEGEQLATMKPLPLAQLAAALVRGSAVLSGTLPQQQHHQQQQQQQAWAPGSRSHSRVGTSPLKQQQQQQQQAAMRQQQLQPSSLTPRTTAAAAAAGTQQEVAPLQQVTLPCELLRACCSVIATQVNAWDGPGLTKLLWSLSRLGSTACLAAAPDALLEAVYTRQQQLMGVMTPQQAATSLYALAKMGVQPPQTWVDHQLAQLSPAFSQLPGQNLAEVVAAVAAFDWAPPQAWLRSYMKALSTVAAAEGMSPWQLRKVRLGLSAVAPKAAERWELLLVARRQQEHAAWRLFTPTQSSSSAPPPPPAAAAAAGPGGSPGVQQQQQQQQQERVLAAGAAAAPPLPLVASVNPPAAAPLVHLHPWLQEAVSVACDDLPLFPPAAAALLLSSCVTAGAPAGAQLLRSILTHGVTHTSWVTRVTPRELSVVVAAAAVYRADAAAVQRLVDAAAPGLMRQVHSCGRGPQQQVEMAQQLVGMLYAVARLQQQYLAQHSVRYRLRRRRLMGEIGQPE